MRAVRPPTVAQTGPSVLENNTDAGMLWNVRMERYLQKEEVTDWYHRRANAVLPCGTAATDPWSALERTGLAYGGLARCRMVYVFCTVMTTRQASLICPPSRFRPGPCRGADAWAEILPHASARVFFFSLDLVQLRASAGRRTYSNSQGLSRSSSGIRSRS